MELGDRIRLVLTENNLKQKDLANVIGVTESYISAIVNKRTNNNLSQSLARLIEEKYGYNARWVLEGEGAKLKQVSKNPVLSIVHQKAIMKLETMNDDQIKAVLAFMNALDEIDAIYNKKENI